MVARIPNEFTLKVERDSIGALSGAAVKVEDTQSR
jgi:hypothetical protein